MTQQKRARAQHSGLWGILWALILLLGGLGSCGGDSDAPGTDRAGAPRTAAADPIMPCGDDLCTTDVDVCVERDAGEQVAATCEAVPDECREDRTCACLGESICEGGRGYCRDFAPNVIRCLTPPGSGGSETTLCGEQSCLSAQEVCVGTVSDEGIDLACVALPPGCALDRSCGCVGDILCAAPAECVEAGEDNIVLCAPAPDGGGTADTTPCGDSDLVCATASQVCVERISADGTSSTGCEAVPAGCAADRSCACLDRLCTGTQSVCSDVEDNVIMCSS